MIYNCSCGCKNCITRVRNVTENLALHKTKLSFQESIIALYRKVFQEHIAKCLRIQSYSDFKLEERGVVDTFESS